ncbi:MAG: zinc ribbon domain-containing protein [Thermoleophilia bacterium]
MPTYEYRCPNGHTFELFQRMSDPPPAACEVCGASPVERVLFAPAIHYKGSGFYSTDYGRGRKRSDGSSSSSDAGGGAKESSSGGSSDSGSSSSTPSAPAKTEA